MNCKLTRDSLLFSAILPFTLFPAADIFFFPQNLAAAPIWFILFDLIAHMTAPVTCLMLVKAYRNSHHRVRIFFGVLLFAVIAQFPFARFHGFRLFEGFNMFFSLAAGLLILICFDSIHHKAWKILAIVFLFGLSIFCEWSFSSVLWILLFYALRESNRKQFVLAMIVLIGQTITVSCLWHLKMGEIWASSGLFVVAQSLAAGIALLVALYESGRECRRQQPMMKRFFYLYYPIHFAVTGLVATVLVQV